MTEKELSELRGLEIRVSNLENTVKTSIEQIKTEIKNLKESDLEERDWRNKMEGASKVVEVVITFVAGSFFAFVVDRLWM